MGFCDSITKGFLFVTNFLIFLLSAVVLSVAIWILVDKPTLMDLLEEADITDHVYTSMPILCLIVAAIAIFISFLGCCGAWKESRCLLGSYFASLLVLTILITVGAAIGLSQGTDIFTQPFIDSLAKYDNTNSNTAIKDLVALWDKVQSENHCCGVNNAGDWSKYNPRYDGSSSYGNGQYNNHGGYSNGGYNSGGYNNGGYNNGGYNSGNNNNGGYNSGYNGGSYNNNNGGYNSGSYNNNNGGYNSGYNGGSYSNNGGYNSGSHNSGGYNNVNGRPTYGLPLVPRSCCDGASDKERCQSAPTTSNGAYVEGCYALVMDSISEHQNVVGGVAIAIIVIMAINLVASLYMCTCYDSESDPRPRKRYYGRPGHQP